MNNALRFFCKAMGLVYANPPFSLLAKVLTKIAYEGGRVVMCTPDWGCSYEHAYWRQLPDRMTVATVQLPDGFIYVPQHSLYNCVIWTRCYRKRSWPTIDAHAKGTRGLPEGRPDRARGTHRPRRMAYQRARVRDTRTGRPATRSGEHAGREGGNERDTTPGTGPNPPHRPRAPRTHRWGTAPAKAVVAHSATPQPLG